MKTFLLLLVLGVSLTRGGVRCTFGGWACTAGCVALGHSSGLCDGDGRCWCSGNSISLDHFRALLPSRCDLGHSFCEATCNAIGRINGSCSNHDCTCSQTFLTPTQFGLCGASSTCRMHCQANGHAWGYCDGWNCKCVDWEASGADQGLSINGDDA